MCLLGCIFVYTIQLYVITGMYFWVYSTVTCDFWGAVLCILFSYMRLIGCSFVYTVQLNVITGV